MIKNISPEGLSKENKLEMLLEYLNFIRDRGYESLVERDKFTAERELKTLEIYLNCSVGLLGFISLGTFFIKELSGCVIALVMIFVLASLLNIVLMIITRNKKVNEVEQLFERRGNLAKQIEVETLSDIDKIINSDDKEFEKLTYEIKEKEKVKLEEIRRNTLSSKLGYLYTAINYIGFMQLTSLLGIILIFLFTK